MMLYNGNTNGATRDLVPEPRRAPRLNRSTMKDSTVKNYPVSKVALIRSIANHAADEEFALAEIRAVLAGASIDDLMRARTESAA